MNGSGMIEWFQTVLTKGEARRKELRVQLEEIEREMDAIQLAYKRFLKDHGIPELPQATTLLKDKSLTKRRGAALVEWARNNNDILLPKEAKKALIAAGLLKAGKGAGWIVYGTIASMDCWEKIEPGKYRLNPPQLVEDEFGRPVGRLIPAG